MMARLAGKTTLVTGAGQGIGRASVLAMDAEDARMIATDLNPKPLNSMADQGLETGGLDFCDADSVAANAESDVTPDVLFNCAGFVASGAILGCDEDQRAQSMNLNLSAMYRARSCAG